MIRIGKCKIKKVSNRASYGGKAVTRVVIDFNSDDIMRDRLNELLEWFMKKREPIVVFKLQDRNSTLDEAFGEIEKKEE